MAPAERVCFQSPFLFFILCLGTAAARAEGNNTTGSDGVVCPAPMFRTVEVECWFLGESVPCNRSQPVGTKATFTCAPHHHFLYDFLPPSGVQSKCKEDGKWSVNPFRCVPVCGQPTGKSPVLVNNGETVNSAAQFPWHVTVYEVLPKAKQICGGSLITTKYFISAAHCFFAKSIQLPEHNFRAALGKTKRDYDADEDEEYSQARDFLHIFVKNYGKKKFNYVNDIALVELAEVVTITAYVMPVCIDWTRDQPLLRDGDEGTVAGYGGYKEPRRELQFGKLPYISEDQCRKNIDSRLAVFTQMHDKFCAGVSPTKGKYLRERRLRSEEIKNYAGTDVAKGDSGGGLAFKNREESYYLHGVVSVGLPGISNISFFTNVTSFIPWMSGIIAKAEVSGKRCGLDLTETEIEDGAELEENSVPWMIEVGFQQNSSGRYTKLWHGILLEPDLVLTRQRSDRSARFHGDCQGCGITDIPVSWLRIISQRDEDSYFFRSRNYKGGWSATTFVSYNRFEDATFMRKVRRVHSALDVWFQYGFSYNLVLLELESPLNVMPACIDLTESAAVQQQTRGTMVFFGVHRRYENGLDSLRRDYPYPYWGLLDIQGPDACRDDSTPNVDYYHICTKYKPDATGGTDQHPEWTPFSGALMVSIDNTWYLRGVAAWSWQHQKIVYTDLADKDVKSWLSKTKDNINKTSCGNVNLCKELDSDETLNGHLPWDVRVSVEGSQEMFPGVVIHPTAVLTDANKIVEVYSQMINDKKNESIPSSSLVSIHWGDKDKGHHSTKVETSQNWTSFWNKLSGAAFASNLKCLQLLDQKQVVSSKKLHKNCAGPIGGTTLQVTSLTP